MRVALTAAGRHLLFEEEEEKKEGGEGDDDGGGNGNGDCDAACCGVNSAGDVTVLLRYCNGPLLRAPPPPPVAAAGAGAAAAESKANLEPEPEPEAYEELGAFADEVAQHSFTARGVMVGATAIARAEFGPGRGRVLCMSPHPESTHSPPSLANSSQGSIRRFHRLVQRAVLAVAPRAAHSDAAVRRSS